MRLFQAFSYYPSYRPRLRALQRGTRDFAGQLAAFFSDRYGAAHILLPIERGDPNAFFTNWDDEALQRAWARENGLKIDLPIRDILLAQIEAHRTDVLYNIDPARLDNALLKRLPGCVRRTIAWRAAPSGAADFSAHDLIVSNFPSLLLDLKRTGCRTAYLAPGHDAEMDDYASNDDRPIDVIFVGGYTRYHKRRALLLEAVSRLAPQFGILMHLDRSRLTTISESALGRLLPLRKHMRPYPIRSISRPPVFGRDLYHALSRAKIVLNGAIDMAGRERGNMRCFEAMGCASLMLSDEGDYPEGMVDRETIVTYQDPGDAVMTIRRLLKSSEERRTIAQRGQAMVSARYSKRTQWDRFENLAG